MCCQLLRANLKSKLNIRTEVHVKVKQSFFWRTQDISNLKCLSAEFTRGTSKFSTKYYQKVQFYNWLEMIETFFGLELFRNSDRKHANDLS